MGGLKSHNFLEAERMENYRYLLDIALILLSTKVFGLFTRRLALPSVVGEIGRAHV